MAYTPTGSWSANTTYAGLWRRVGDSLDLDIKVAVTGTPTTASLTVNLPSGFAIDTTRLADAVAAQSSWNSSVLIRDAGTDVFEGIAAYNNTTSIAILKDDGDGTVSAVTQAAPMTWANGDYASITLSGLPILGWGANGTLGQDADTRVVAAKYTMGVTYMLPRVVTAPYQFDTLVFDYQRSATYGAGVTFTYFVPVSGVYELQLAENSANSIAIPGNNNISQMICLANGASFAGNGMWFSAANSGGETIKRCANGFIRHFFNAGTAITFTNDCDGASYFNSIAATILSQVSIARLSGPAQVQAPEVITARYSTNAGQSISNNTITIIDFEDVSYDDHGCVTTGASWKFTAPRAGKVNVSARAQLASNAGWAVGENAYLSVFKNGVEFGRGPFDSPVTATIVVDLDVDDEVNVLAGDTIDIRIFQLSGGSIALVSTNVLNYVCINYVGGITQ